jgi:hypothetical protein
MDVRMVDFSTEKAVSDNSKFLRMQDSAVVDLVGLGPKPTINTRRTEVR